MQFPPPIPVWEAGLIGAWFVAGLAAYSGLARLVAIGGGKVEEGGFGQPDLLLCGSIIVWFGAIIATGFGARQEHGVTEREIVGGAVVFLALIGLIWGFLIYRGISPVRQFGFSRRGPLITVALAAALLLCAMPALWITEWATHLAMGGQPEVQRIVSFFNDAARDSDRRAVYLTMALGVIVAPAAEETIFRGYIYGVLKRYVGPVTSAVISAGLFAGMHLNAASLPALFVLALCLTLAYEATGSLLVNMVMHSLFNLSMFILMLSHSAT